MESFFEGFFTRMPSWFFIVGAIIILIGLAAAAWWIVSGARSFSKSLGKEKKLYKLQEELHKKDNEIKYENGISLTLLNVVDNSRLFLKSIINLDEGESVALSLQRIIESLSSDIKTNPGDKHRCGFWISEPQRGGLLLINGSSGFTNHYLGKRLLGYDKSVAGRCFRKKEVINIEDVYQDEDFEQSDNDYISLICIPIGDIGVLTVDGKNPFDKNAESIAELYGSIIELVFNAFVSELTSGDSEAAVTTSNDDRRDDG